MLTNFLLFLLLYILFPNLRRKLSLLDALGEFLEHVLQMVNRSSHQSSDRFKGWFRRCARMRLSRNKHLRPSKTLRHTFGFRGIQCPFQFRQIIILQINKFMARTYLFLIDVFAEILHQFLKKWVEFTFIHFHILKFV